MLRRRRRENGRVTVSSGDTFWFAREVEDVGCDQMVAPAAGLARLSFLLVFVFIACLMAVPGDGAAPDDDVLRVFVVPHSHCDPGWWKTYEEYFRDWARGILDSVTDSLNQDPKRRFIWSETSFLRLWWDEVGESNHKKPRTPRPMPSAFPFLFSLLFAFSVSPSPWPAPLTCETTAN
jgi:Glycosyl hydrolases family 38 N-terminal domain